MQREHLTLGQQWIIASMTRPRGRRSLPASATASSCPGAVDDPTSAALHELGQIAAAAAQRQMTFPR